ncbi:uncharacterized protein NPIL_47901 [Nephila pilipes]|uniref:Uncharacterized protein n=1 Tax=Nephila pilipes TaxID=299642 RepID=A0A8X6T1U6_NEPPI|nr:uncharacterized protein NPIL_47901 [Nephila pilipes]
MDEASIKKMRGRAKSAFTRIINSFSEHLRKSVLLSRIERLDNIFKDFDHYDAMLPEEQSETEEFEEKYFEIKTKYQSAVDALNSSSILNSPSFFSENCSTNNFKLPRLNIPQFSGKYTDWLAFKDLYVASVHNNKSLPSVSHANCASLRQLADTSDEVIRGLKSLGEAASSRDVWLIYLLVQKPDSETPPVVGSENSS